MEYRSQDAAGASTTPMGCMEVWGGSGPRNCHFVRPGLDIHVSSLSSDQYDCGGGDLHLISSCASGRITRLLLADICATGDQFERVSATLRSLMRRNINRIRHSACVKGISDRMQKAADEGGFASTLLATYFSPSRRLTLCNAGHPSPLLRGASDHHWRQIELSCRDALPDAAAPSWLLNESEYQTASIDLSVGDQVLFYSNCLAEAVDQHGQTLGGRGISDLVGEITKNADAVLPQALLQRVCLHNPALTRGNDATVILVKATATRVGWKNNLLAPLRLLRRVADRVTLA